MKRHFFYAFLGAFVATTVVTLLGVAGIIPIAEAYLKPLVLAVLVESVGAVIALFNRTKFFGDEQTSQMQAIVDLKLRHSEAMAHMKQLHLKEIDNLKQTHTKEVAKLKKLLICFPAKMED